MSKTQKLPNTNAARLLSKAKIPYSLHPYEVDPEHLEATHVAESLGEDINRVFKTIVMEGERTGHFVCVVPGNSEIDLKKAAKAAGDKKCDLLPLKELTPLTGYIRGGCSPGGMKKAFPTFFHSTALDFDTIFVSAGMRGLQLEVNPQALIDYCRGSVADITAESND